MAANVEREVTTGRVGRLAALAAMALWGCGSDPEPSSAGTAAPTTGPPTAPASTPPTGASSTEPPLSSGTAPDARRLLDALAGARWVVVERGGERWPLAYVPYVEFAASSDAAAPILGGNDGCNWFGSEGRLDGDRLALAAPSSTAMDCGQGTGGVMPVDGDRLRLADDGTGLALVDGTGRERLRYARLDRLAPAEAVDLTGTWHLDASVPSTVTIDAGGSMVFGSCSWSWSVSDRLVVTGVADDPDACLAAGADNTSSRLVEMVVGGAVDARVDAGGDVYLADEQFVIRLTRKPPD